MADEQSGAEASPAPEAPKEDIAPDRDLSQRGNVVNSTLGFVPGLHVRA